MTKDEKIEKLKRAQSNIIQVAKDPFVMTVSPLVDALAAMLDVIYVLRSTIEEEKSVEAKK